MTSSPSAAVRLIAALWCVLLVACAARGRGSSGAPVFEDPEEQFKYGSVGIESEEGIPYWIWQVLPRVFADKLPRPGGYSAFGFVWEPGRELPVGFAKANLPGGPRVAINCAFCHTAAFRTEPGGARRLVAAGPGHLINPQAYVRFLQAAAEDPRFDGDTLLPAISRITRLSWAERMRYRYLFIPGTRKALLRQKREYAWMDRNPDWGPGRIDPFNPVKFRILKQPVDTTVGNSDMVPIWNMKARAGMSLHWDGLTTSLRESVLSSAIGDGASRKSIALSNLERVEKWLLGVPPAPYPFEIDRALAARGRPVFEGQCAQCHAPGGSRTGSVIPVDEVGTDRHRLDMWTAAAANAYNAFADRYPWDFGAFRKTNGYVAVPLDGIWLRAPFLHNGSVPTLHDLLERAANRTPRFYRGYDVYDPQHVGFVSSGEIAAQMGAMYDTARPGNGNGGHLYGVELSAAEKQALIEFLKTL